MPESTITVQPHGDVTVVGFSENSILDMTTIKQVGNDLHQIIDAQARPKLVLDFSGVRFLSSQALGMLVMIRKKVGGGDGKLMLTGMRQEVGRLFKITNLDRLFEFCDTSANAVEQLRTP